MGRASAALGADAMVNAIQRDGRVVVVVASAVSQSDFLNALGSDTRVDWSRVTALHLDEYVGISRDHPASFRRFQLNGLFSRVKPAAFHELGGDAPDIDAEVRRYTALLEELKPSICFLGIGENGHLAFNDPPVDFDDPQAVRVVQLDDVCRMQQVHDGQFPDFDSVPKTALTLTIPAIMRIPELILNVPGKAKAEAVRAAVEGPVTPDCPASVLQRHTNATLFLDRESAQLLSAK
jgi:glucosamine-6-phosphate deaminase